MACYDIDHALFRLRDAIDFAEMEQDYIPARLWAYRLEQSIKELKAVQARLNDTDRQDFLLTALQATAACGLSPEEASRCLRLWLNTGQIQAAGNTQPMVEHFTG
jgi:hypothetical protein